MKKILVTTLIISLVMCAQASQADTSIEDKMIQQAKQAIKTVGGTLQTTMVSKMKEGGPTLAADFCSTSATDLAKKAAASLPKGVKIKRITDKPRNSNNKATIEQSKVLQELEEKMKTGSMPNMLVKKISDNHYQVYKPLKIIGKCTACHGTEKTRDANAYKIIVKNYPNDKAINYKKGDFRGAFLVDIIK